MTTKQDLVPLVSQFPPRLKQAMYAGTVTGTMIQGNWGDCAFNQAGRQVGATIQSSSSAVNVFGIGRNLVSRFITTWDRIPGGNQRATQVLQEVLLEVGLEVEPFDVPVVMSMRASGMKKAPPMPQKDYTKKASYIKGIKTKTVYLSAVDKFNAEFTEMAKTVDMTKPVVARSELEQDVSSLNELLLVGASA